MAKIISTERAAPKSVTVRLTFDEACAIVAALGIFRDERDNLYWTLRGAGIPATFDPANPYEVVTEGGYRDVRVKAKAAR